MYPGSVAHSRKRSSRLNAGCAFDGGLLLDGCVKEEECIFWFGRLFCWAFSDIKELEVLDWFLNGLTVCLSVFCGTSVWNDASRKSVSIFVLALSGRLLSGVKIIAFKKVINSLWSMEFAFCNSCWDELKSL